MRSKDFISDQLTIAMLNSIVLRTYVFLARHKVVALDESLWLHLASKETRLPKYLLV